MEVFSDDPRPYEETTASCPISEATTTDRILMFIPRGVASLYAIKHRLS